MIVYVVLIIDTIHTASEDYYVKCVVDSKEKAREKIESMMKHFLKRHDLQWESVDDRGDWLGVNYGDGCYIAHYELSPVL